MRYKHISKTLLGLPLMLATFSTVSLKANAAEPALSDLINNGKASINLRYRFEYVDQDGFAEEAESSTLRSRLTFKSGAYKGFSFLGEFDDLTVIGDDDYNSTANGRTEFPVVADPTGTDLNQAFASFTNAGFTGSFGRQRVVHTNQRFIGGVAWRQNEQTYDGLRLQAKTDVGISFDYAYVYKINRIFGPDDGPVQPADHEGNSHFVLANYKYSDNHTFRAFGYLLDIDEDTKYPAGRTVGNSSNTFGIEYVGKFAGNSLRASYAIQKDAGDSDLNYEADYYVLEGGIKLGKANLTLGYEVLGADNGVGFKTPYATLHKFQGWADKFLVTPGDGIEDAYVGIKGAAGPVKLGAFYHTFSAEDSSADFGTEIDLVATWPATKYLTLQLKFASFSTDDEARFSDTDKVWLTVNFKL
ncbi:MAG: alginate export family protein [Halioglobus sp.]